MYAESHLTSYRTECMKIYDIVSATGCHNFKIARVPIPSTLIVSQWRSLLQNYEHQELLNFLEFGFPVGFEGPGVIQSSVSNYASALAFPDDVDTYITTELGHKALFGPYNHSPFRVRLHVSPLMTRLKRDSDSR